MAHEGAVKTGRRENPDGTWELVRFRVLDDDMMPLTVTHMAVFYNVHVLCRLCSPRAQVPTLTNPSMTV